MLHVDTSAGSFVIPLEIICDVQSITPNPGHFHLGYLAQSDTPLEYTLELLNSSPNPLQISRVDTHVRRADQKWVGMEVLQEVIPSWVFTPVLKMVVSASKEGEVKGSYSIATNSTEENMKSITIPFSFR